MYISVGKFIEVSIHLRFVFITLLAAGTILGRVKALYPHRRFPTPADLVATPDQRLRRAVTSKHQVVQFEQRSPLDVAAKVVREKIKSLAAGKMGYSTSQVGDLVASQL